MIAPLRARHRVLSLVAFGAAPAVLAVAILARQSLPPQAEAEAVEVTIEVGESETLWFDHAVGLTWRLRSDEGEVAVELAPLGPALPPDLLLYLTTDGALGLTAQEGVEGFTQPGIALPDRATLLGPFGGDRGTNYRTTAEVSDATPAFVLYSLAHGEVVAGLWLESTGGADAGGSQVTEDS